MPSVNLQGSSYVRNSSGEVANSKYGLEPMYAAPKAKNSTPKIGSPTSGVKNGPATIQGMLSWQPSALVTSKASKPTLGSRRLRACGPESPRQPRTHVGDSNTRTQGEDYGVEPTIAHPNGYLETVYRPPGNPVLVGSGSYSPTQQGIPTHRYGGPAALKVEIRQACFQWISQGGVHGVG